jgi:hypothetical protein
MSSPNKSYVEWLKIPRLPRAQLHELLGVKRVRGRRRKLKERVLSASRHGERHRRGRLPKLCNSVLLELAEARDCLVMQTRPTLHASLTRRRKRQWAVIRLSRSHEKSTPAGQAEAGVQIVIRHLERPPRNNASPA